MMSPAQVGMDGKPDTPIWLQCHYDIMLHLDNLSTILFYNLSTALQCTPRGKALFTQKTSPIRER
jgi:hypothetical protein